MATEGREVSVVYLKALYYGVPITDASLTGAKLKTLLASMTEVKNLHGKTFKYEETAPNVTYHKNQLTGKPYRNTTEDGEIKMSFTIGAYDFKTKADFQGGTATDKNWQRGNSESAYKSIVGVAKDGVYVVFPKASISANGADSDEAIGLAIVATAMDTGIAGLVSEYWFDASEVETVA